MLSTEMNNCLKDPVVKLMTAPIYFAFAWLGLIFQGLWAGALLVSLAAGTFIDGILLGQAVRAVKDENGVLPERRLRRAVIWRRTGLVTAVVGTIIWVSL